MTRILGTIALTLALTPFAIADSFTNSTSRAGFAGTDSVDWGQLGPTLTAVADPVNATSTGGISVSVHQPSSGTWERLNQGSGWNGNFAPGDRLLWDNLGTAPWTITFGQSIDGLGFQIQADHFGAFTALLNVYDSSNNLIGSFSENGNSSTAGDNSAIFIGIQDTTGADIKSAQISLSSASSTPTDFAINRMDLVDFAPASTPEPASIVLLITVALGIALLFRRARIV
jgi:hypothetical protein